MTKVCKFTYSVYSARQKNDFPKDVERTVNAIISGKGVNSYLPKCEDIKHHVYLHACAVSVIYKINGGLCSEIHFFISTFRSRRNQEVYWKSLDLLAELNRKSPINI